VFVITADHVSSNVIFPETRSTLGAYSVPILFFKPDNSLSGEREGIAQQIDIVPSVLGILHYDRPFVAFGRNVFDDSVAPFAFNYSDGLYNLYEDKYLLTFDGKKAVNLFNYQDDRLLNTNIKDANPQVVRGLELHLKAIIQQFNNRMVDDNLTVK
jgi:hypothetical protein